MSFLFRWFVRPLLTFTLGLVVFLAVGILTVDRLVSNKLLNADFYADVIAEQDTYNRIYDEVMLEDEVRQASAQLFPMELVSHEDLVGIFRDVAPPEYLQGQVEGAAGSIIEYLREDASPETDHAGELRIYVDLGPALARVKPVVVGYIRGRIDRIPEEQPEESECTPSRVIQLGERYTDLYHDIAAGTTPASIPSIRVLPELCRTLIFDAVFGASRVASFLGVDSILGQRGLDSRVVAGLRDIRGEIRRDIVAGDAKEALKKAVPVLVSPTLDDNIERFRAEALDADDRLEIIDLMGEPSASEIRADAAEFRSELSKGRNLSRILGIGLLAGGALALLLVHLPDLGRGLRRVGVSLVLAGLVYLVLAKLVQSAISDRGGDLLDQAAGGRTDIPESLARLLEDLLVSFARNLAAGLDDVAIPVLIAGAAVFAASFFVPLGRRLVSRLRE